MNRHHCERCGLAVVEPGSGVGVGVGVASASALSPPASTVSDGIDTSTGGPGTSS